MEVTSSACRSMGMAGSVDRGRGEEREDGGQARGVAILSPPVHHGIALGVVSSSLPPRLVLFDGVCGLCDASVQRLLAWDEAEALHYAPLQGVTAAGVKDRHGDLAPGLGSIIFVEQTDAGERVSVRSTAVVRICRALPWPWRGLALLWWVPWPLRDLGYRLIARVRYRIWGQRDSCRLPTEAEAARFLD